jgi:hypothetical protein
MGSLYGYEVLSELPLRRLNRAPGTRGRLTVAVSASPPPRPDAEPTSTVEDEQGNRVYASYETGSGCLLVLPPCGAFDLDPARMRITVHPEGDDADLLEHRLATSAACTLLAMRGILGLHASAIRAGGRATIFCGPSRRGKSTLARALGEAGNEVLGEDGVVVAMEGRPAALPGARGVRVRPGAPGARADLVPDPGPAEPGPCPVGSLVLLGERRSELMVEGLEPARALALLTPHLVHTGGRDSIAAAFALLAELLASTPVLRAALPDDLRALPEAAEELIAATLAGGRIIDS